MNFTTVESLAPVAALVNDAGAALAVARLPLWRLFLGPLCLPGMWVWDAVKFVADKIEDNKRLSEVKLQLYKEAVKRQAAIIEALKKEAQLDAERVAALKEINAQLVKAIREMKEDLDSAT